MFLCIPQGRRGSISAPVSALLPQSVTVSMGRRTTLLPRHKTKTINLDELEKPRFAVEKVLTDMYTVTYLMV